MSDQSNATTEITKEEFCARFKAEMLSFFPTGIDDEGKSVAEYAEITAPTYWDDPLARPEGPEACVANDMSYWGED